jgi:hypothetical protein
MTTVLHKSLPAELRMIHSSLFDVDHLNEQKIAKGDSSMLPQTAYHYKNLIIV